MNILPKKSWHVRNKDNVARVRRDEAEAEAERKKREARVCLAEQEARTEFLRKKARLSAPGGDNSSSDLISLGLEGSSSRHLNLFTELQEGGNKEYEEEKKQEKERQEKALGILTYLGQSAAEAQTTRPWYQKLPERDKDVAKDEKLKGKLDPLAEMERLLRKKKSSSHKAEGKKEKGERRQKESRGNVVARPSPSSSSSSLEQLRQERQRRERAERARTEALLAQRAGTLLCEEEEEADERKRGYNSQFHPQLARKRVWEAQK